MERARHATASGARSSADDSYGPVESSSQGGVQRGNEKTPNLVSLVRTAVYESVAIVDVVAVEDGPALVPGQEHGDPFGDVCADQVAGGGVTAFPADSVFWFLGLIGAGGDCLAWHEWVSWLTARRTASLD